MIDREIISRHSNLFDLSGDTSSSAMQYGFQFSGAGWLGLMEQLCERLQPLVSEADFRIVAVKSKFASLRISYRNGSDAIDAEIEAARAVAAVTCENCGAAGTQQQVGGWVAVRCVACAE
jgi:hypothetical protein